MAPVHEMCLDCHQCLCEKKSINSGHIRMLTDHNHELWIHTHCESGVGCCRRMVCCLWIRIAALLH